MRIGKACFIFENLDSEEFTDQEKALAVYMVMNMPTHMSIKKDSMINAIKWLFDKCYDVTVGGENGSEKKID